MAGCMPDGNSASYMASEAGFLLGLWHGMIAPFSFIVSLFDDSVNVYEVANSGHWYDLGFVIGADILFGSTRSALRRD